MKNIKFHSIILSTSFSVLAGCSSTPTSDSHDVQVLRGPAITENNTSYTSGLSCVSDRIHLNRKVRVTIDKIPDKSGKVNSSEGYKLSQGVESMAITALTKIKAIQVVERSNIRAFNIETDLMKNKRIGDDRLYKLANGKKISYKPMLAGKIYGANYYITGAITEVNYNLYSGGKVINISGLELGSKKVRMNVAMDLRIVDVKSLEVIDSVSLQKQFIGKRTKAGVYRFLDNELTNFDGGSSTDEPLQVGVRSLVERGVAHLVGRLFSVQVDECYNDNIKIR
jgi:curli production assembly/transport component CsgG/holdfast attachment protein HfaB